MNIFEQLNILLAEAESKSKSKFSDIPIHPEMETKEQGEMAAAEKILKLFQKLQMGNGSGEEEIKDSKPEIPDDIIDPMMKSSPKSSKDKTFEKNKLTGWDEKSDEKVSKEVEFDDGGDTGKDDTFDDFDYRENLFGDDEDDIIPETDSDDRSEDEKLKDAIDDAIDLLDQDSDKSGGNGGDSGDDSGANWGDESEQNGESQNGGTQNGGKQDESQSGGNQSGSQQGESQKGESQKGESGTEGGSHNSNGSSGKSSRKKRLEDLKKSLESGDMSDVSDSIDGIKNSYDDSTDNEVTGGQIENPSDDDFREDMSRAGFDDKTIDKMSKRKNTDSKEDYTEGELEDLRKKVVDGLEDACKKKGGSSLATSISRHALNQKLKNEEWKELLKLFLKGKSINRGKMASTNKGIAWGHKNHLWRGAVLPRTDAPSKGTIQRVYCFVDFSGSVDKKLVLPFLGKVIDLCDELKYAEIHVYGFGEHLSTPRVIDKKSLKVNREDLLEETWKFIKLQDVGLGTENFQEVAIEMNKIKRKERDAIFLIFGDGFWTDAKLGPQCLKYDIANNRYIDDICVLAYYQPGHYYNYMFTGTMNVLKEIVGIKHIVTSEIETIKPK